MKSKRILRFYFNADILEKAFNRLILNSAYKSAEGIGGGVYYVERILALIAAKDNLSELWKYLDNIISGLCDNDREVLRAYANMRTGIKHLPAAEQKAVKKAVIKLARHARNVERFSEGIRLVNDYYCLM